jgi:DNA polymerase III subunit epsilon
MPSCRPRRRCRFGGIGHNGRRAKENPVREVVFDTETTGLDPYQGHRLVEIGCIELVNRFPTGQTFHRYLNPERDIPPEAFAIHGLSYDFLKSKAIFTNIAVDLLAFIGDAALVAHNASFDLGFLNAELERIKQATIPRDRLIDTLLLARRKYPGGSNRLDDLCVRFGIDNSRRTKHGALLDAELLAEVYVELVEARQAQLGLVATPASPIMVGNLAISAKVRPAPLRPRVTDAERTAHGALVAELGAKAIWNDYTSMSG